MRIRTASGLVALSVLAAACGGGQSGDAQASATSAIVSAPTTPPVTIAPPISPSKSPAPTTTTTAPPSSTTPAGCVAPPSGITNTTINAGGVVHDLRIFEPSDYNGSGLLPVVLDWHGYDQSGAQQAALSGFETLAETEGFIVVHPTGVPNPGWTQAAWELDPARDPNRDDIAFAGALIDELVGSWCADPARVYSTGMSDGGFFTSILICELSDRIAAATSVAGVMRPPGCNPSRVVPYYAFHGIDDPIEPFDRDLTAFDEFAAAAGCGPPDRFDMSAEVVALDYTGCPLSFFQIVGGGHSWPGSPVADQQPASLGHTTMDIGATAISWELFKSVTLPQ